MKGGTSEGDSGSKLRERMKALSNRYAIETLQALSPATGDIIPELGWEDIVDRILVLAGLRRPKSTGRGERSQQQVEYEKNRQRLSSGGTLYDSMKKLVSAGYVQAVGESGKKQRRFRITHDGRIALSALTSMGSEGLADTEVRRTASVLLKHKNFTRPLPAQEKFLREIDEVNANLLIQMPPGSGKTFLAMIIILMRLQKHAKCLYLAPYTSLTRQIMDEYAELFSKLGFSIVRLDAQADVSDDDLASADLVVGIYESVLGSIFRNSRWTESIELSVVDEITELDAQPDALTAYNLGSDRSARLDCLITLLKSSSQIIALCSRFGESQQVSGWLEARVFRPSVRLSPDEFMVTRDEQGVEILSTDGTYRHYSDAGDPVDAVLDHVGDCVSKSILFIVGSRGGAETLAMRLANTHPLQIPEETVRQIVGSGERMPAAGRLEQTLRQGIAFHHAGLETELRGRLERAIKNHLVRFVAATTGITYGMSFPFDCVVVLLTPDSGMGLLMTRARYLQFAGRIGEYHLAQHGGAVYIVYEPGIRQFRTVDETMQTLLQSPVEPLKPRVMDPSLMANLVIRECIKKPHFGKEELESDFMDFTDQTFGAVTGADYSNAMMTGFLRLFDWLVEENYLESYRDKYRLDKETRAAIESGLDLFDYSDLRTRLESFSANPSVDELVDVVMGFRLVQASRPRTVIPSRIELGIAGLSGTDERYTQQTNRRNEVKKHVLCEWLDEKNIESISKSEADLIRKIEASGSRVYIAEIDEGDLVSLVQYSSEISMNVARFLNRIKNAALSKRFELFARQLQYGVREDLGQSDLFEIRLPDAGGVVRQLSRPEARTLFNNGYNSIDRIVRRDMDASKPGLARDRFAKNSGLDNSLAKAVYKAALEHVRRRAARQL